jgi:hypothetical protein
VSDTRVRTLERRWCESGALEDERAWIHARVRAGSLSEDRLELARALGAEALGGPEDPPLGFQEWLEALPFRGGRRRIERDSTRVGLAIARTLAPCARALGADPFYARALEAAEAQLFRWGESPGPALAALEEWRRERDWASYAAPEVAMAELLEGVLADLLPPAPRGLREFEPLLQRALYPSRRWSVERSVEATIEAEIPAAGGRLWRVRRAIREELLPWVLGYGDPIRRRVAERGEVEIWPEDLER